MISLDIERDRVKREKEAARKWGDLVYRIDRACEKERRAAMRRYARKKGRRRKRRRRI